MNRREALKAAGCAALAARSPLSWPRMGRGSLAAAIRRPLGLQAGSTPSYFDTRMAFINLLKSGGNAGGSFNGCPWRTTAGATTETNEEAYVQLDSDGYLTSSVSADVGNGTPPAQSFDRVQMRLLLSTQVTGAPGQSFVYPPGPYRLKYVGQPGVGGSVGITGDATFSLGNTSTNTYVNNTFSVTTPTTSLGLNLVIIPGTGYAPAVASFTGSISGTTLTVSGLTGTIGNGMALTGCARGTKIVQALGGSTYQVSISQTVTSAAMTALDQPRDISVVLNSNAAAYDAGAVFNPAYLALYKNFSCIRGMQWNKQIVLYQSGPTTFSLASGSTSLTLTSAWQYASGVYTVWFWGGQSVQATFTYNSTAVTWTTPLANPVSSSGDPGYDIIVPQGGWANRTPITYVTYAGNSTLAGVPDEIIIDFANALTAQNGFPVDCWLNVRLDADDTYITNLGTLAKGRLGASQKAYFELSNEVWNFAYIQTKLAQMFGCAQWPAQPNDGQQRKNWYGMRCAVMSELLATPFGADFATRCVPVLGAQGGVTTTMTDAMNTAYWTSPIDGFTGPASAHKIKAISTNFYWPSGGKPGKSISAADATTLLSVADPLSEFFALMDSNVGTVANGSHTYTSLVTGGWHGSGKTNKAADVAAAAAYGIPVVTYEGGDNFFADDSVVVGWASFMASAQIDARMGTAYQAMLEWYAANVGATAANIIILFCDTFLPSTVGSFGLVETVMQTTNATNTPKLQAALNYISGL